MMNALRLNRRRSVLFILLTLMTGLSFLLTGCGNGPTAKVEEPNAGQFALDFSTCYQDDDRLLPNPSTSDFSERCSISTGQSTSNLSGTGLTVEAWVKDMAANLTGTIFSRASDRVGIQLFVENSIPKFAMKYNDGLDPVTANSHFPLTHGVWTHIAGQLAHEDHSALHAPCDGFDYGSNSSIAVDSSGFIHISHYGQFEHQTDRGELKYTTNASGGWVTRTVARTGKTGQFTSIALDSSDKVHISFHDATENILSLKYATNSGVGAGAGNCFAGADFNCETVDNGGGNVLNSIGKYNSIAVDSTNTIHISYYTSRDQSRVGADNFNNLMYATGTAGAWVKSVVDSATTPGKYTSIKVDSGNKAHISYMTTYNGGLNDDLKYATNNGVAPGAGTCAGVGGSANWNCSVVDLGGNMGGYSSLAVDSSKKAHISYYDRANGNLKYATNASGAFVKKTVDSTGNVGTHTSIVLDSVGAGEKINISYYDVTNKALKYATNKGVNAGAGNCFATSDFNCETVDNSVGDWSTTSINPATGNPEFGGTSITRDRSNIWNLIKISYYDQTLGDLMFANGAPGTFTTETADPGYDGGEAESPHLDIYVNGEFMNCRSTGENDTHPLDVDPNNGKTIEQMIGAAQPLWSRINVPNLPANPNYFFPIQPNTRLNAIIDEVRLWKEARAGINGNKIASCMDNELSLSGGTCSNNTIGYWKFNDGEGQETADHSGGGNGGSGGLCDETDRTGLAGVIPTGIPDGDIGDTVCVNTTTGIYETCSAINTTVFEESDIDCSGPTADLAPRDIDFTTDSPF